MSSNARNILIGIVIALAAYFGWQWLAGDDAEAAIHQRLNRLEEIARKTGKESTFQSFGSAKKASEYVAERPYLELMPRMGTLGSRDELAGALAAARGRVDTLELSLSNRQIEVAASGDRALVNLRAQAKAEAFGESQQYSARYRMEWEEIDGEWLIVRVERLDH